MLEVNLADSSKLIALHTFAGHVFRTEDAGLSWRALRGSPGRTLTATMDLVKRNNLYAASEDTVFRTTDGGMNWLPGSFPEPVFVIWLRVNPHLPGVVYAVTKQGTLTEASTLVPPGRNTPMVSPVHTLGD